jgi:hypothetical protein
VRITRRVSACNAWTAADCNVQCPALDGSANAASSRGRAWHDRCSERGEMKDGVFIGVTVAFFALAWVYARAFDRL